MVSDSLSLRLAPPLTALLALFDGIAGNTAWLSLFIALPFLYLLLRFFEWLIQKNPMQTGDPS